ncbi:MAG TPA: ISLre2 family transposase [Lachnospiraceae bacterium]|nr:ISLre2 family transposase [Lachnospiraceae bacterium]
MIKSIQQFGEIGINILGKVIEKFLEEPENHANFIYGVTESVTKLGLSIIAETLEEMDKELCLSSKRKQNWSIVKRDETTLLTSLGNVTYKKTLFIQKQTRERVYLLDKVMELKSHARMTEDVEARILEEAVESSYRKGGKNASITDGVSKQTVKNKIHQLEFPKIEGKIGEKKKVKILHINADEDHVSAQFYEKKGDIQKKEGRKYNTFMPKMVYLYEDVVPETDSVKVSKPRYRLKNVHYFGGMYEGKGNASLWEEVELYIEEHYDVSCLEKVYLCGDGANWIKSGCEYIDKSVFVLDRFHRNKYINNSVSHMLDSKGDAWDQITDCFSYEDKKEFNKVYRELKEYADTETKQKSIEEARKYLLSNWDGIVIYNTEQAIKGCSAEGHVSHVYASRMSSRPLGWSRKGTDRMSRLRIYYYNGGKMLDLVRNQKQELQKVAGGEELYSCSDILQSERKKRKETERYVENMTYRLPYPEIKKKMNLQEHIWRL